ncbi:MAG: ferrochelatase [Candidatus Eisenbacteria bacterium]
MSPEPIDSVLFLGFGGPENPEQILPFLRNVVFGRGIPDERLAEVEHHYHDVGGRSPYNELTERQRAGVERHLRAHGVNLPVYCAMRNWDPYMHDVIAQMNRDGRRHALGVILAAHRSEVSWERYMGDVTCAIAGNAGVGPAVSYLDAWYDHPRFLEANAQGIEQASGRKRGAWPADLPVLFTAHSIPSAMAEASPYVSDLVASCEGVARLLGVRDWELCYQSRSGNPRTPWLEPDIVNVLRRRAAGGGNEVVVQAIGFISDHVEVLFDLDIEAKEVARELGMTLHRAPCVNDHPEFTTMLGELLIARIDAERGAPRA